MTTIRRREFLATGALAAGGALLAARVAFASANTDSRFVLVILRGALDGLAAVPPYGDADYARLRGELAVPAPGASGGALRLDGTFGLHPHLAFLHEAFGSGELAVFHAVASPYRERSHFDGQDVLESGGMQPHAVQSGWLNRALAALPPPAVRGRKELGVALGQNVPLVMRGAAEVASWSPSRLAALDEDTLQRVTDLYAGDALLSRRLADALAADAIATQAAAGAASTPNSMSGAATDAAMQAAARGGAARYGEIIHAAAGFLRRDDGPRVAVFDTIGWDTHANEGGAEGQLAGRLGALDAGLRSLKDELGPAWRSTAVLAVTEFGRTAAVNGTRGTDHGTATTALLVGGAVRGGRVIADWPGLAPRSLYQQRDLAPTLALRDVLHGVLVEHLGVPESAVREQVFVEGTRTRAVRDLFRA
jgi:uncharacterized protein (DUF1501 family)